MGLFFLIGPALGWLLFGGLWWVFDLPEWLTFICAVGLSAATGIALFVAAIVDGGSRF